MIEQYCRAAYQRLLVDPIINALPANIQPITISYCAGLIGLLLIPLMYYHHGVLAIFLLCLSGYLDTLDGSYARLHKKTSDWGCVIDIIMDRIVELSAVIGIWCIDPAHRGLLCLCLISTMCLCITSFLVVGIFTDENATKSFYYSPGLIERAEFGLFIFAMILLPDYFTAISATLCFLMAFTTIKRLAEFKQYLLSIAKR